MAISKLKPKQSANAKQWTMNRYGLVCFHHFILVGLILWNFNLICYIYNEKRKKTDPVKQRQYARFWANNTHHWLHLIASIRCRFFHYFSLFMLNTEHTMKIFCSHQSDFLYAFPIQLIKWDDDIDENGIKTLYMPKKHLSLKKRIHCETKKPKNVC